MKELQQHVKAFIDARPVIKKHDTPRNVMGKIQEETKELEEEVNHVGSFLNSEQVNKVRLEAADVLFYLMTLGNIYQFDLEQALEDKLAINNYRFPAVQFQVGEYEEKYAEQKRKLGEWK